MTTLCERGRMSPDNSRAARPLLATILGIQPLWRLQINSRVAREETRLIAPDDHGARLPYYYFQRVVDGRFEVRSSGGCAMLIDPVDVCNVIPCEPIQVQAMPRAVFLRRSRIPLSQRQARPPAFCYAPANVLYAVKDRYGNARASVLFLDDKLNQDDMPHAVPLVDEDHARIQALARRTVMPVLGPRGASYSADHGERVREASQLRATRAFIAEALGSGGLRAAARPIHGRADASSPLG